MSIDLLTRRRFLALSLIAAISPSSFAEGSFYDPIHSKIDDPVEDWKLFLRSLVSKGSNELEMASRLNIYINQVLAYVTDEKLHGDNDVWESPEAALRRGKGDCEEYAFLKYASLHFLGVDTSRIRLVYGHLSRPLEPYPEGHLTASLLAAGSMPLILDNVTDLVLPIGDRKDFTPIASFDNTTTWRGFTNERYVSLGKNLQGKWDSVKLQMEQEGILSSHGEFMRDYPFT